jgi:hypothetical protein
MLTEVSENALRLLEFVAELFDAKNASHVKQLQACVVLRVCVVSVQLRARSACWLFTKLSCAVHMARQMIAEATKPFPFVLPIDLRVR